MVTGKIIHRAPPANGTGLIRRRGPCIWIRRESELTVVTIRGEIDASDIDELSPYAQRLVRDCGLLIIDAVDSDFIAVGGLRALLALWSAEPGAAERPREREVRIQSQSLTVVLRSG
jgi:hypothetical protein